MASHAPAKSAKSSSGGGGGGGSAGVMAAVGIFVASLLCINPLATAAVAAGGMALMAGSKGH